MQQTGTAVAQTSVADLTLLDIPCCTIGSQIQSNRDPLGLTGDLTGAVQRASDSRIAIAPSRPRRLIGRLARDDRPGESGPWASRQGVRQQPRHGSAKEAVCRLGHGLDSKTRGQEGNDSGKPMCHTEVVPVLQRVTLGRVRSLYYRAPNGAESIHLSP